jgi:molybdate transport system regulatory protein
MADGALTLRANLWLERDGRVVLSPWRVRLLQAIQANGSISAAARRMGVQYRCAWDKLNEMEAGLGVALVERQVGGSGGGGARLTPEGDAYVRRFTEFVGKFEAMMLVEGRESFGSTVEMILAPPGPKREQASCETPALDESEAT